MTREDAERLHGLPICPRETALAALFALDRTAHDLARQAYDARVAPIESGFRLRCCGSCGRQFVPQSSASRFCSHPCLQARERRRYRERVGKPSIDVEG
jgi:hypothetical protein